HKKRHHAVCDRGGRVTPSSGKDIRRPPTLADPAIIHRSHGDSSVAWDVKPHFLKTNVRFEAADLMSGLGRLLPIVHNLELTYSEHRPWDQIALTTHDVTSHGA